MAHRHARLLRRMTAPTGRSLLGSVGGERAMARSACLVTRVGRSERRLTGMAARADCPWVVGQKFVGDVACLAGDPARVRCGVRGSEAPVAPGASGSEDVGLVAVWLVAGDAGALFPMADANLQVTADTRSRCLGRIVGRVAARADRVSGRDGRGERHLVPMASDARARTAGDEGVRLMAAHA